MKEVVFTDEQARAAEASERPLDACVVAGPGSGKTTVLVEYFRNLVAAGVDPLRILAITFTEKAAGNMRKKLAESFHDDARVRASLERAWVSTVHGFCARLLKEYAIFAGVDPDFSVADERDSQRLQQEAIEAAVEQIYGAKPAAIRALIRGLSAPAFEDAVRSAYDAMRGAGLSLEELSRFAPPSGITRSAVAETLRALRSDPLQGWRHDQRNHLASILEAGERIVNTADAAEALRLIAEFPGKLKQCKGGTPAYHLVKLLRDTQLEGLQYTLISDRYECERGTLLDLLAGFDRIYRERKRQAGLLDFADLEEFAVRLLESSPETARRIRAQFDHILMDEFQDTNGQQAKLLELVRRLDRFYAVGDINQSIFGFRHAEPEVFRRYRESVQRRGGKLVELVHNFRSRPEILRAVETITHGAAGVERRELVAAREFEEPRPAAVEVLSILGSDAAAALESEARWVAHRIVKLLGEEPRFAFRDVAVLVRNTEVLAEFAAAFEETGIPYQINRGRGFYEAREVKDLCHLLRVIANPRDEVSMAAVLRSPLVQVSDEALLRLRLRGENLGSSLLSLAGQAESEFDAEDYARLRRFGDQLRGWRIRREHASFDRLLVSALDDCGYQCASGGRGWANIEKFLAQARQASSRMSLDEFVDELARLRSSNPREPDAPPEDSANAVNVMTVHSAKGLEFPIVFVAALHKGVETNPEVIAFSRRFGLGARWRNPAGGDKDDLFQHAIREERKQREQEESDRLLYVAMTRAEEHLVLSFSGAGKKPQNWARDVAEKLQLALDQPGEEMLTRRAPDGCEWSLRLVKADGVPDRLVIAGSATASDPVEWIDPLSASGQQDTDATVTELAAFARCPRRYYLEDYLGWEGQRQNGRRSRELAGEAFGTQVHALLAGAAVPDVHPEAVALAQVFRHSTLGRRAARATRLAREFDFVLAVEELVLRGQVDLWFEEAGELVIVDYKTDSVSAREAHQRAPDYALQLRLYGMALERFTGRAPDQAWLHFLRPDRAIEVDLAPSLLDSPEQIVRDFMEAQATLRFPLREGEHCLRCPFYRDLCPAG